ncbi:phospholipase [Alteribacter lacisalsi]|uniref:Phospholipase n=1 Tax=Alteribacter lacisalsi TaxID=2045244 RepID=A0A2W0HHW4_9BACI|nr:phospholipase D-like domain-containing protein [Alteribacter lacisalsi]PYZ97045.1 phospholipase [Alteribacter lacisalsi]
MKKIIFEKMNGLYFSLLMLVIILTGVAVYGLFKPLPEGVSYEGSLHDIDDARFYYDVTYETEDGEWVYEQQIFDEVIEVIDRAENYLLLDLFLFNDFHDREEDMPELSRRVTDAVLKKKDENPEMNVIFITDEFNTGYGSHRSPHLDELEEAGVHTIISDLTPLRDSKPIYSSIYRTFFQWFGRGDRGWLPHPLSEGAPSITARSYLKMLNLKANHRKVVVSDKEAFITSANPHDGSAYYSNIGFRVTGSVIEDVWEAEKAVASFSSEDDLPFPGSEDFLYEERAAEINGADEGLKAKHLTESSIKDHLMEQIENAGSGDRITIGAYYLAEDSTMDAIVDASFRDVEIRVVLDPNSYSFNQETQGLPNRPAARELKERSEGRVQIRWYHIDEDQYHSKIMVFENDQEITMIGGSSNFTRRNMDDFNLDASIMIQAPLSSDLAAEVNSYFERLWTNEDGIFTLHLDEYEDDLGFWKPTTYRLQQWFYLTTY